MRFAWVGVHAEGLPALEGLLAAGAPIAAVLTLTEDAAARKNSNTDYRPVCERYRVPLVRVPDLNGVAARRILAELKPDVVFVIGWHQVVQPETLRLASVGMIGAHASLLPHNRGSAPINWALIHGDACTGSTLFWLSETLDSGDIIAQRSFPITPYDTCASLYQQVSAVTREMLLAVLPRLLAGERPGRAMAKSADPPLRRRRAADGVIDWSGSSRTVYDFIRALTRPYPGAFSTLEGRRWRIWQAALPTEMAAGGAHPGEVIGPVVSPVREACGQMVACGSGAITLLCLEADDGTLLGGPALSDQAWTGQRWT